MENFHSNVISKIQFISPKHPISYLLNQHMFSDGLSCSHPCLHHNYVSHPQAEKEKKRYSITRRRRKDHTCILSTASGLCLSKASSIFAQICLPSSLPVAISMPSHRSPKLSPQSFFGLSPRPAHQTSLWAEMKPISQVG